MSKGLEALEKIDHTICMNNLENNIQWDIDKYDHCACVSVEDFVDCYDIIEKELKALEDIEEELGISLVTLFKALKNGIYEKFEDGEYVKFNGLCMPIKSHKLKLNVNKKCLERGNDYFYFKDYGKTWALTKEELL